MSESAPPPQPGKQPSLRTDNKSIGIALAGILGLCFCALLFGFGGMVGSAPIRNILLHLGMLGFGYLWWKHTPSKLLWILLPAAALRLLMLPMPVSDDVHRYVWEGMIQLEGANPYLLPPDAEPLAPLRANAPYWEGINHKDLTAIYPPGVMLIFRGLAAIHPSLLCFKLAILITDFAVVLLLVALLKNMGRQLRWAGLYAFHPLALLCFAGEAHLDAFMLLGIVGALLAYYRKQYALMFIGLALAVHVKYVALLILPFFILRTTWRHSWVFGLALLLPIFAFGFGPELLATLKEFSTGMHYNGSVHQIFRLLFQGSGSAASIVSLLLLAGGVMVIRGFNSHPVEGSVAALALLLLLAPTVHLWYFCWILPLLCLIPARPLLILGASLSLTYLNLGSYFKTGIWIEHSWVSWLVWMSPLLFFAFRLPRRQSLYDAAAVANDAATVTNDSTKPRAESISILVPVLNEENELPGFFQSLDNTLHQPLEILIGDAGSTDQTVSIAEANGAQVIHCSEKGRGNQIASLIPHASGDVLFIAHADMRFEPHVLAKILVRMQATGIDFGSVGGSFDSTSPFLRRIAWLNQLRARFGGISFGDQGQFIRRDALETIGGFPAQPLLEDVEFSLRMRERERPLYLKGGIRISPRKWEQRDKGRHTKQVIHLVATCLFARFWGRKQDASAQYKAYYRQNDGVNTTIKHKK